MDAREIALRIINEVYRKEAYANIVLAREINARRLAEQDRRFITELVYGTIKAGATVDWILGNFLDRSIEKIPAIIRDILRMGIYQLFFLSKVPPSATCNQAVELAKKYGHGGTVKFVNAVLRSAARHPEKAVYPDREAQPIAYIALRHCHPVWLVARWIARFGVDGCEELCRVNNLTPPLSVRTNTLRITRAELLERLAGEEVVCEPSPWTPEGIICREFPALGSLSSLQQGLFQVQDESSMLVAHVLDPEPGEFVIDACGAPGGKSTHIAAKMQNRGRVLSVDIHAHKSAITTQNAARLGIDIIEAKTMDALELGGLYGSQADRVLVDAPCSGLGVLRRKPDSRWRKTEAMLRELPLVQRAILDSAATCVKPGGVLVYSTCTTEPEENEEVIGSFLAQHTEYTLQITGQFLPQERSDSLVQLWPHVDGVDGFFIARLSRRK